MKLVNIDFDSYSILRSELNEYVVLCNTHNYIPTKDDFKEIIDFLLLFHSGTSTMCESIDNHTIDNLYESLLNEDSWDSKGDFDSAVGLINNAAKFAVVGGVAGVAGVATYVNYLFKKVKVMVNVAKEKKVLTKRINNYKKLYDLKVKKWELEGKKGDAPEMKIPPIS